MKPDGGVWQVLSPPCAGDLRWDEKGNSVSECRLEPRCVFDSLEAANLSPWSVHINPPCCVLILHIIALCSCLGQQFTVFLVDKLVLCGPQVQVITPLLLGLLRLSAQMLIGKRQSYQLIKLLHKPPKHQTVKMTHWSIFFSLTAIERRTWPHFVWMAVHGS